MEKLMEHGFLVRLYDEGFIQVNGYFHYSASGDKGPRGGHALQRIAREVKELMRRGGYPGNPGIKIDKNYTLSFSNDETYKAFRRIMGLSGMERFQK